MHRSGLVRVVAAIVPGMLSVVLCGCGMTTSTLSTAVGGGVGSAVSAGGAKGMSGSVHGGQFPVSGGVVTMWAAGTSVGYGQGATPVATATTDAQGNFFLNPQTTVSVSGYSYNGTTLTVNASAAVPTGTTIVLSGFPTSTFLNGQEVNAASASGSSFTANFAAPTFAVTAYAIASNVATFTVPNSLSAGDVVTLSGFPTSTFLNGQQVTVISANANSFTGSLTNSNVATTTEGGAVTLNSTPTLTEAGKSQYTSSTVSSCTAGQYLYLTAVGGNPGLTGVYGSISNSNLALMAALPTPCSPAANGTTYVTVNELTTVSAVWALQQFMSINPTGVEPTQSSQATPPWTIGAPSTNVVGMANAFTMSAELVNPSTGIGYSSTLPYAITNTFGTTVYQTQVVPDFARINTIADILAACANTAGGSGICSSLISDTTPSATPAPIDTTQIAYYMATQPSGFKMAQHGLNSPYWLCYNYVTPTAPFQSPLTCTGSTPTFYDWVIAGQWTLYEAVNGGTNTKTALIPASVAIDGSGNVWVGGGSAYATVGPLNEFAPSGQLIFASPASVTFDAGSTPLNIYVGGVAGPIAVSSQTITYGNTTSYGRANSVAIDTTGNAWMANYAQNASITPTSGTSNGATWGIGMLTEVPVTGGVAGTPVGIIGPSVPTAIAFDASNDLLVSNESYGPGTRYYLSIMPSPVTSGNYYSGDGRQTSAFTDVVFDQNKLGIGGMPASATCTAGNTSTLWRDPLSVYEIQPVSPTITQTGTGDTAPGTCAFAMSIDTQNNLWGTNATTVNYFDFTTATPTVVALPTQTASYPTTGLLTPAAVTIDGLGNIWTLSNGSSISGLNEFTSAIITGTGATDASNVVASTVLSPSSTTTGSLAAGFLSTRALTSASKLNGIVIDGSGNLWLPATAGSPLNFVVGAAAPVKTPIAVQLGIAAGSAGSVGHRP